MIDAMREDPTVVLMGVDIGRSGGPFAATQGMYDEFGPDRVIDTPIAEMGLMGAAVGASLAGLRPIAELMFSDFIGVCLDPILNQAAKITAMSGGEARVPLVVRTQYGGGGRAGAQHSQSLEALFAAIPGLTVVCPSSSADAYGLMRTAIADDTPVIYIDNRRLYAVDDQTPEADFGPIPFGSARVVRKGTHLTCITYSRYVDKCEQAAARLHASDGIEVEVLDLRSIHPIDWFTIEESVRRTSRAMIVHEAVTEFGVAAEIAAGLAERCIWSLDGPVVRVGARRIPVPFSPPLEDAVLPSDDGIEAAMRSLAAH